MPVVKFGKSLAVRLPVALVKALALKEGDDIEFHVAARNQIAVSDKPGRNELLKRLRAFRGSFPAEFKFDREEANARTVDEVWNAAQSEKMTEWSNEEENVYNYLV